MTLRNSSAPSSPATLEEVVANLVELARDRGATPLQRDAIAREWIVLQALRLSAERIASGAISRLSLSEAHKRVTELALELLGPDAQLSEENAPYGGYWQKHRSGRATAIEPGASERFRTAIADGMLAPSRGDRLLEPMFRDAQEQLRAEARAFLETNPDPSWSALAELGWTGMSISRELGGRGLGFLEEAVLFHELGRAVAHTPYWSTVGVMLPALPVAEQKRVARGETSWTLALGPLVPDLDTATRIAVVGGDSIWELEGAEREVLPTSDEARPLGVVVGGTPGQRLASSELLPSLRTRSLAALALEACGAGQRALELAVRDAREHEMRPDQAGAHALATAYVELELAHSLAFWAAWCIATGDAQAPRAAAAAKAACGEAAAGACEIAIRVLGAAGRAADSTLSRLYHRTAWARAWEASSAQLRGELASFILDT